MTLSEVISSVNIVEYISQYVDLTEKNGEYWGLSPIKEESTPSFSASESTNLFYDFASGKGGNVLEFIKIFHKCDRFKAADLLRAYCGDGGSDSNSKKMSATLVAKKYMPKKKKKASSTAEVLSADYMNRYEFREDKLKLWEEEGISFETMRDFSVCYDGFSDRIVYPVRNTKGEIINVSGRIVDPQWKEKGLRKYTYFKSFGVLDTIYGLWEHIDAIAEKKEIIVFEGVKSVLLAHSWGIKNTVALLTSHLNPHQLMIFAQLGFTVVFALDKGVDISEDNNINKLKRYTKVVQIVDSQNLLEEKMSPVDAGRKAWQTLYERRMTYR